MRERRPGGPKRRGPEKFLEGTPLRFFNESIDLHGKPRDEVKPLVSALIDRHYTEGGTVRVICGTGHGVIKSEVMKFVKSLPSAEYPYEIRAYEELGPAVYIYLE